MAKTGRPRVIESPKEMLALFDDYRQQVKSNPIKVQDWVGGAGKPVTRKKERPLTFDGFEVFVWRKGVAEGVEQYFLNRDGKYADFIGVCAFIKKEIRDDQINGGMSGIYNPSITQRLNNLKEQTETTTVVHTMNLGK
jgi:hypothetical protein